MSALRGKHPFEITTAMVGVMPDQSDSCISAISGAGQTRKQMWSGVNQHHQLWKEFTRVLS